MIPGGFLRDFTDLGQFLMGIWWKELGLPVIVHPAKDVTLKKNPPKESM